jgi:hypothetical protein
MTFIVDPLPAAMFGGHELKHYQARLATRLHAPRAAINNQ